MTPRTRALAALGVSVALSAPARGGEIVGYVPGDPTSKATYDRFTGGFPSAPVANMSASFVAAGMDVTGVGWRASGNWGLTLVSPQHFVTAAHVGAFSPGEQVRFLDANGVVRSYTVGVDPNTGQVRQTTLTTTFTHPTTGETVTRPSDIRVVSLDAPIPAGDLVQPIAVGVGTAPVGTDLLAYGQNPAYGADTRHIGTNTLDAIGLVSFSNFVNEATWGAIYDYTRTRPGDIALIGGDSGSPLLTRQGDTAVMLGTHYGVAGNLGNPNEPYISVSAYLPAYLDQLNALVTADGQALTFVPVPEPACIGVAACVAWGLLRWRRRAPAHPVSP